MAPDSALAALNLAVVGHVEWVSFVAVEQLPVAGSIDRATAFLEEPAGGGAVVAVQLARLSGKRVHESDFFFRQLVRIMRHYHFLESAHY